MVIFPTSHWVPRPGPQWFPQIFPPLFRRDDEAHEAIARAAGNLAVLDSPHDVWDYIYG